METQSMTEVLFCCMIMNESWPSLIITNDLFIVVIFIIVIRNLINLQRIGILKIVKGKPHTFPLLFNNNMFDSIKNTECPFFCSL